MHFHAFCPFLPNASPAVRQSGISGIVEADLVPTEHIYIGIVPVLQSAARHLRDGHIREDGAELCASVQTVVPSGKLSVRL